MGERGEVTSQPSWGKARCWEGREKIRWRSRWGVGRANVALELMGVIFIQHTYFP